MALPYRLFGDPPPLPQRREPIGQRRHRAPKNNYEHRRLAFFSERVQNLRQQACRGGWRESATHAHRRGYPLPQLLYRFRAVSETNNTSPLGACLLPHNLWEIATFCVSTLSAE
jgi:hypothetical protein